MGQQRGGCVWLETTHLAYSSQAPYAAGTEQGAEKRTIPAHQAFIFQSTRRTWSRVQVANWHHVPRRATPGGPLGTLTKLGKNSAACLLLKYVTDNIKKQNPHFEESSSLILCNNEPLLDQTVTCNKKWILHDNRRRPTQQRKRKEGSENKGVGRTN